MQRTGRWRKLVQWQLRTLLVLITLIAIGLALYMKWIEPYRVQYHARLKLEKAGGAVDSEAAEPAWMVHLVGKKRFERVVSYRAATLSLGDKDLAALPELSFLQRLYLCNTQTSDVGAQYIGRLPNLERLSLWRTQITDDGLPYLAQCAQLRMLDLHSNCITDDGLAALEPLRNLRQLTLGGAVCGPGLKSVARLPVLAKLDLYRTAVGFDDLAALAGSPIEELRLAEQMPASVATHLAKLPRLRDYQGTLYGADDRTCELLAQCVDLRTANLVGTALTDRGTAYLGSLRQLQRLTLRGNLTDRTLQHISSMDHLTEVNLRGRFSLDALDQLAADKPELIMSICTILPAHYYASSATPTRRELTPTSRPSLSYELDPLISFMSARRGRTAPVRPSSVTAVVHFPATVADLADVSAMRDRVEEIQLQETLDISRAETVQQLRDRDRFGSALQWSLARIDEFPNLQRLTIRHVPRNQLNLLQDLARLQELTIEQNSLTDEDFNELQLPPSLTRLTMKSKLTSLTGLRQLRERYPSVTVIDEGMGKRLVNGTWRSWGEELPLLQIVPQNVNIRRVILNNVRETVDCDPLSRFPNIDQLIIGGYAQRHSPWHLSKPLPALTQLQLAHATDRELHQLQYCPSLQRLKLDYTSVSDSVFEYAARLPELTHLSLMGSFGRGPWITGRSLHRLTACPGLQFLDLSGTNVRDEFLADLTPLKHLAELRLANTRIGDAGCRLLAQLPALQLLTLQRTNVTDVGMKHLQACPQLKVLNISYTAVTDGGLEHLPGCATLKVIEANGTQISPAARQRFRERFPTTSLRGR